MNIDTKFSIGDEVYEEGGGETLHVIAIKAEVEAIPDFASILHSSISYLVENGKGKRFYVDGLVLMPVMADLHAEPTGKYLPDRVKERIRAMREIIKWHPSLDKINL